MLAWARGGYSPCSLLRRCAWLRSRSRALALHSAWRSVRGVGAGGMSDSVRLTKGIAAQHGTLSAIPHKPPQMPQEREKTAEVVQPPSPPSSALCNRVLGRQAGILPFATMALREGT
jgi:hypothetical protein